MRPWFRTSGLTLAVAVGAAAADAVPRHLLRPFLNRLKGVPASLVEQRPNLMADRARLVAVDWKRVGPEILPSLAEADRPRLEGFLGRIASERGLAAARAALEAHYLLAAQLPQGQERATARVDRDLLDAWICAEEGRWQAMPDLAAGFGDVLHEGDPSRVRLATLVRDNLKKMDAALRERDKSKVQLQVALLRRLVEELELR